MGVYPDTCANGCAKPGFEITGWDTSAPESHPRSPLYRDIQYTAEIKKLWISLPFSINSWFVQPLHYPTTTDGNFLSSCLLYTPTALHTVSVLHTIRYNPFACGSHSSNNLQTCFQSRRNKNKAIYFGPQLGQITTSPELYNTTGDTNYNE